MPTKGTRRPCARCGSMDRYPRNAKGGGGGCRPCAIRIATKWHAAKKASPDADAFQRNKTAKARLNKYKISQGELDSLMEAQGGVCAICRMAPTSHIDHDHKTEAVRGLLCLACNVGLGCFKDSLTSLQAAIDYLISARRAV